MISEQSETVNNYTLKDVQLPGEVKYYLLYVAAEDKYLLRL